MIQQQKPGAEQSRHGPPRENGHPASDRKPTGQSVPLVGPVRRVAYLLAAGFFFALGMIGVVLPVLPTTPFLLLTSYFLVRSWPALNRRMLHSRIVGPMLRDWHEHRAVRAHVKVRATGLIVLVVSISVWFGNLPTYALIAMLTLVGIGLIVIWRLPVVEQ